MEVDNKDLNKLANVQHLNDAFLQLSFAIKLWNFYRENGVNKEKFDIALEITDQDNKVCLACDEFNTENDIIIASENNITVCFGAAAITLWEAIREHVNIIPGDIPNPIITEQDKLAALIYMIRCCFAHGFVRPKWEIKSPKYKIIYLIGNDKIDLTDLNGTYFSYPSIGGCETLWFLKSEAVRIFDL
jgi:phenolic acid decarboxylase